MESVCGTIFCVLLMHPSEQMNFVVLKLGKLVKNAYLESHEYTEPLCLGIFLQGNAAFQNVDHDFSLIFLLPFSVV